VYARQMISYYCLGLSRRGRSNDVRLISDTYTCAKVTSYEAHEAGATAEFKYIHTFKGDTTMGDVIG
jgi:hypothetical protein